MMIRLALVGVACFLTVGCGQRNTPPTGGASVTWYRDVLPLVQTHCQGCHVAGGIAPFALDTYESGAALHSMLASAVASRQMPPWPPDESCVVLKNSRRLNDADVDVFVRWSAAGAPAGDPADAPPPPAPAAGLSSVDATLDPGFDYVPNASVTDDYHCFVVGDAFTTQKDLTGFEVVPGTPNQVHHVIMYAVQASSTTTLNQSGHGWTCYGGPGTGGFPKMLGGWAPGGGVVRYPEGTGIRIAAGEVIVMQVHYNTSQGTPAADRTKVKLQFAQGSVNLATIMPVLDQSFAIPPQSTDYSHSSDTPLFIPSTATVWGVTPHMHQKGRRIRVWRVSPQTCLIDVPDWDFHWQQSYQYATPIRVSPGDVIRLECTWDNPTDATVKWGEGTADEMCIAFFYGTAP